jgi:hypothetical protein
MQESSIVIQWCYPGINTTRLKCEEKCLSKACVIRVKEKVEREKEEDQGHHCRCQKNNNPASVQVQRVMQKKSRSPESIVVVDQY